MSRQRPLGARAARAARLVASVAVPVTFQRTLMPRSTSDQAIVTGLSAASLHALSGLVQDSIQSGALLASGAGLSGEIDQHRWGRASILADVGAVLAGLALQQAFPQRPREPMPRAGARTAGFLLSGIGAAGTIAGVLDEVAGRRGRASAGVALQAPVTAALTAANLRAVRQRALRDADLPPEPTPVSVGRALGMGIGVTAALSAFGAGERRLADLVGRGLARVLPGPAAAWRPVGHSVALAAIGGATQYVARQGLSRIERTQGSVEAAFDIPPPIPLLSGSVQSDVAFDTLSRAGRRFVWTMTPGDLIGEVMGEPARCQPIRTFVGVESAPTDRERVDLALRELDRTNAFDRSWLMVALPTGTGYVNYAAASILELLSRGDCATVAMQYSARPSPLSLDRVDEGRQHARLLLDALRERLAQLPEDRRPRIVLFGESLGAWTSQDAYLGRGTQGLVDDGIDRAIWIGTPHFSQWKEEVLYDEGPHIDRSLVAVCNDIGEWEALAPEVRERVRFVMITHYDDGVAVFGPELAIQAPPWLGPPTERPRGVPKGMRWAPITSFFQVLVDMKNAANVVPGVFEAKGHDYRADLLPFFHAVLGLDATEDQLERIAAFLEHQELRRSEWMKRHARAGKSLAAAVVMRAMEEMREAGIDPEERLIRIARAVAAEEFDVPGGGAASTS